MGLFFFSRADPSISSLGEEKPLKNDFGAKQPYARSEVLPIKGSCDFQSNFRLNGCRSLGLVLIRTIHPAESWQRIPSRPGHSQGVKSLKNFSAKIFLETLPRPLTLTKAWGTNQSRFSRADCWFVRYISAPLFAWQTIPAGTKPSRGSRGRNPCKLSEIFTKWISRRGACQYPFSSWSTRGFQNEVLRNH